MRKASLFVALAAALVFAAAGSAITNGEPDGTAHPEVGALLATHAFSDGTWEECTGTLISSRVFLTAEHCDLGVNRVEVTFASTFVRGTSTTYWGTWYGDPDYNKTASDPNDLAVVVLDKAVPGITPARLPAAGSLVEPAERPAVHSGRVRRAVGHERCGRQDLPLPGRPLPDGRDPEHGHAGLAEDLRQPVARRRQHVLRRLRRPELPRRRLLGDEHHRRHDDHRRHALPVDERGLPARHARREGVPRAVRHAAVTSRASRPQITKARLRRGWAQGPAPAPAPRAR